MNREPAGGTQRHQVRKGMLVADGDHQTSTPASEPIIVITRVFDAPRELVWRAWSDPAQLAAWYAPRRFTVPRVELDFRPGGVMELDMRGLDGTIYPTRATFLEIVPPERIVLSDEVQESDAWGETPPPDNVQTITFEALADSRTRLTTVIRLGSFGDRAAMLKMGAATGWRQTLDNLAAYLAALQEG